MENSSRIDFKLLSHVRFKKLFEILVPIFDELDVGFYLIGAIARDAWFAIEGVSVRATTDIDMALLIGREEQYQQVKEQLIERHGFRKANDNAYKLHTPFGYPVDLVPFGAVEIDEAVEIEGSGLTFVHVTGFGEVFKSGVKNVDLSEGLSFSIATLPSLVLLKLIAYDDRPEDRVRDLHDIANILEHYFNIESELIYDKHTDLFSRDDESYDLEEVSARVIGRELRSVLSRNEKLRNRFLNILKLGEGKYFDIPELMASRSRFTIEHAKLLLSEIALGIEE